MHSYIHADIHRGRHASKQATFTCIHTGKQAYSQADIQYGSHILGLET